MQGLRKGISHKKIPPELELRKSVKVIALILSLINLISCSVTPDLLGLYCYLIMRPLYHTTSQKWSKSSNFITKTKFNFEVLNFMYSFDCNINFSKPHDLTMMTSSASIMIGSGDVTPSWLPPVQNSWS